MKKDLVGDIRARLSVEEVVGSYLDLKRSGDSYKALSPFKSEKTPSLVVTPSKEIWKDFSSGKGGDIFSFVMEHEGVDFKEALNILATKAGLNPEEYSSKRSDSKSPDLKKALLKVLKLSTDFYVAEFHQSALAKQYVKNRGFQAQVVKDFQIGYSPESWQALCDKLQALKVPAKLAYLAGLIKRRPIPEWLAHKEKTKETERWGDFFAERLMIPLSDPQGQVIGFTGRLLSDKEGIAKYVNSKQTLLYNKSKHVFGYFQAKETIRKEGFALVVEGNLDVVACHQAGYKQTVAAGGTALTVDHLKIIGRLTKDIRLAFDGDAAGTSAMERSLLSAQTAGVNLSIVSLPDGCDPDDLIKKSLSLWKKVVKNHQPAPEWLYEKYKAQLDLNTAAGKRQLTDVMLPIINCLNDEVEKDHYLKKLEELGISRKSLDKKMQTLAEKGIRFSETRLPADRPTASTPDKPSLPESKVDKKFRLHLLLGLLLIESELRSLEANWVERLDAILQNDVDEQKVYKYLKGSSETVENANNLPDELQEVGECVKKILLTVKEAEKGKNIESDLETKKKTVNALLKYLDGLQLKADRIKIGKS